MDEPRDKEQEEDAVISSLLAALARRGVSATFLEATDRARISYSDRLAGLRPTSDALVQVGPEVWAVDVMALAAPASELARPKLTDALDSLALGDSLVISLTGVVPTAPHAAVQVVRVVRRAVEASMPARTGRLQMGTLTIAWRPSGDGEIACTLFSSAGPRGLLSFEDELVDTLMKPLRKKATNQARRAHRAGYRTAVLLDPRGHAGIAQGTHRAPLHVQTVELAVRRVLLGVEHDLDAVLLVDRQDGWHIVAGRFPGFLPHAGDTAHRFP